MTDKPWESEPGHVEFEYAGLPCVLHRTPLTGAWCGYVGLPLGHPLHGQDCDCDALLDIRVHGGLDYSEDRCPPGGGDNKTWWVGFSCSHAGDFKPAYENPLNLMYVSTYGPSIYREMAWVKEGCQALAEQLAEIAKKEKSP